MNTKEGIYVVISYIFFPCKCSYMNIQSKKYMLQIQAFILLYIKKSDDDAITKMTYLLIKTEFIALHSRVCTTHKSFDIELCT